MNNQVTLSHTDAQKAIAVIQAEIARRGKAASIAVADSHGELIAFLRMDGAKLNTINIACNKAFTASREQKPSREVCPAACSRPAHRRGSQTDLVDPVPTRARQRSRAARWGTP